MTYEAKLAEAVRNSHTYPVAVAKVFDQGPRGIYLKAEFSVRNGKFCFIPSMISDKGNVIGRPVDQVTQERFIELLMDHKVPAIKLATTPSITIS